MAMASTTITKFAHLQIPLEDVMKATNNFDVDNIIGRGGFGPAYKGRLLRSGKLMKITALRLDRKYGEGEVEFWTEISMLSDLKHANLVSLVGFCDEKDEKIVITKYEAKGSLREHLNNPNLTWTQRLKICVGMARALSYLHDYEGRGYAVIHRNVNSSTFLLDENWEAKLSGFKVSTKYLVNQMDKVLCEPMGTLGYVDPAMAKTGGVTLKSDVYSFGVVLFEILCGRRAFIKKNVNKFLAPMAKYNYENKTLKRIIHPDLWNQMFNESLLTYSQVAYACLEEERADRPDMDDVVIELEKALELQLRLENLVKNSEQLRIRLSDIKLATNDFSDTHKHGACTFYTYYRAIFGYSTGENSSYKGERKTLIKRFIPRDDKEGEEIFFTEIEMLINVKHPRIVTLLGFCCEGFEKILVIELLATINLRGCLESISIMRTLTWEKRMKICIDVAHALKYLHYEMENKKTIINRDINCYNIGLDENLGAMIVEFGCAVFLPPNQVDEALYVNSVVGQKCYVDPEYQQSHKLKRESDVYSFGVVLFEILCGRPASDPIYLKESKEGLAFVARRCLSMGALKEIIDPILHEDSSDNKFILNEGPDKDSLHTFVNTAYQCVAIHQDQRPTMKFVVEKLEKALFYQHRLERLKINQAINEFLEASNFPLQMVPEDIPEEQVQDPNVDEVNELTESIKLHIQKIPFNKLKHLKIDLSDIKLATNNFSETYIIAYGDYYNLYQADVYHVDAEDPSFVEGKNNGIHRKVHNKVILKRTIPTADMQGIVAFFTNIEMLTSVKHDNIVTLLGFCIEDDEGILVLEKFPNGYLAECLRDVDKKRSLIWEKRLKICIDVASALNYLHYELEDQKAIINRHIKSYNIGLEENWGAKIVELGASVYLPPNQVDEAVYPNRIIGNKYYIDPEYDETSKLKRESDVYSFGVVLFEILCGRLANDAIYLKESDKGLAHVARQRIRTGTLKEMIDPILTEETSENNFLLFRGPNKNSLDTFIKIACQCVEETQDKRPTIKYVLEELKKALFTQKNNKDNPRISLEEIKLVTRDFHNDNCIGGGGFGKVYRGKRKDGDGVHTIVAKRLDRKYGQGEQQFLTELQILLEYKHENIIGLVGYCDENDEKIIVYEYASRGSLDRYLNNASLTWVKRLGICIDVATALDFLHGGVGKKAKVIHRDIKTENILLNDNWKAKLADFGLSLISPINEETDYIFDHACGTRGYLDPLYEETGFLTVESDIYSFGVVLFELLCGRSTYAINKDVGHFLPDFVKNKFEEGRHDEVVLKQIKEQIVPESLTTFQDIAYQCLHHEREKRPKTEEVLMQLETALAFQISKSA